MPRLPVVDVDDVARALAAPGSRRVLLRALGAGWLGTHLAGPRESEPAAGAAARKRSRKRRKKPVRCQKLGAVCNRRKLCCKGTRCARGKCQCLAGKKRCGAKCVPKATCCPAAGEVCGTNPPVSCSTGKTWCKSRSVCIPAAGCCNDRDCTGQCHSGLCDTSSNTCQPAPKGTKCGPGDSGRCNKDGVCSQSCQTDANCPPILKTPQSATEFCQKPVCEAGICIIGTKSQETVVDEKFWSQLPCEVFICDHGVETRYSLSRDLDLINATVPSGPTDCQFWTCKGPSMLNDEPEHRDAGTPCGDGGTGRCNGHGICVDQV